MGPTVVRGDQGKLMAKKPQDKGLSLTEINKRMASMKPVDIVRWLVALEAAQMAGEGHPLNGLMFAMKRRPPTGDEAWTVSNVSLFDPDKLAALIAEGLTDADARQAIVDEDKAKGNMVKQALKDAQENVKMDTGKDVWPDLF